MSTPYFSGSEPASLREGLRKARMAIGSGKVALVPTDTAYALVADAFTPAAAVRLRTLRGMAERAPLSVFIPGIPTLTALSAEVAPEVLALAKEFWPGALTLIVPAGESLAWDLGETQGSVALRMPAHPIVLELLSETGPLVQSGAFRVGEKPLVAPSALVNRFGSEVAVYLAAGKQKPEKTLSTVIDASALSAPGNKLKVVREGAINLSDIYRVVPHERFA
ncbi:MAG: L-threonylcarbamoyladenylate synthase [Microbacteriaceae bacterium]